MELLFIGRASVRELSKGLNGEWGSHYNRPEEWEWMWPWSDWQEERERWGAQWCCAVTAHVLWAIGRWGRLRPCSAILPTASPFHLLARGKLFQYHFTIRIKRLLFDIMKLSVIYSFSQDRGLLKLTGSYPGHRERDAVFPCSSNGVSNQGTGLDNRITVGDSWNLPADR